VCNGSNTNHVRSDTQNTHGHNRKHPRQDTHAHTNVHKCTRSHAHTRAHEHRNIHTSTHAHINRPGFLNMRPIWVSPNFCTYRILRSSDWLCCITIRITWVQIPGRKPGTLTGESVGFLRSFIKIPEYCLQIGHNIYLTHHLQIVTH
jgi:hypothetical protein